MLLDPYSHQIHGFDKLSLDEVFSKDGVAIEHATRESSHAVLKSESSESQRAEMMP